MSQFGQILVQVREMIEGALRGRDSRLDRLEERVTALEEVGTPSAAPKAARGKPTTAHARTGEVKGGAHGA